MSFINFKTSRLVMRTLPQMIKFRKGEKPESRASAGGSSSAGYSQAKVASKGSSGGPATDETPSRYQRKPLSQEEIDYVNRGGPA